MPRRRREALHQLGGSSLSVEARLVLCTAGGPEADAAIAFLIGEVTDWPRLLELSVIEGAQPALGKRLRHLADGRIPDDVVRALEYLERVASVRQRYLQVRMLDALRVLSEAAIPVVLLKGAALAHTTYDSFFERSMSDVDLLVPPERAAEAQLLLSDAGWGQRYDARFDGFYKTMHHLPPLIDLRAPSMTVGLEIHTALVQRDRDPFAFPPERMWQRARPAPGLPRCTMVPDSVDRLLHCCIHFAWSHKASNGAWRTFRDVTAMLRTERLDWAEFLAAAHATRASTACYWTLRLARSMARAVVPHAVLRDLRPRAPEAVRSLVERHFSHGVIESERICPSERLQSVIWTAVFRPDSGSDGSERPWKGEDREWRLLRGPDTREAAGGASAPASRIASPGAWLRYLASLVGPGLVGWGVSPGAENPARAGLRAGERSTRADSFPTPPATARLP